MNGSLASLQKWNWYDWPVVNFRYILISRIKKKNRGREQKQHEASKYGIRWSLRWTHSTAALSLYFREVFSLKRAQVQRNKWKSARSLGEVSASQRCSISSDISLSKYFLCSDANSDTQCMPSCQSSLEHRLVFERCDERGANQRTGQDWTAHNMNCIRRRPIKIEGMEN